MLNTWARVCNMYMSVFHSTWLPPALDPSFSNFIEYRAIMYIEVYPVRVYDISLPTKLIWQNSQFGTPNHPLGALNPFATWSVPIALNCTIIFAMSLCTFPFVTSWHPVLFSCCVRFHRQKVLFSRSTFPNITSDIVYRRKRSPAGCQEEQKRHSYFRDLIIKLYLPVH